MQLIPHEICTIMERLQNHSANAYLVGGSVRDMLLGRHIKDFDIVTDARPDTVMELFPGHYPLGLKFGTVVVKMGFYQVEITSFRDIDLPGDLARRDFTINAMAMNLAGSIFDFYDSRTDLASGLIRAVGSADDRIKEDGLRMLRAVRLACQLEFELDPALCKSILQLSADIQPVSPERVRDELNLMLMLPSPSRAFRLLHDLGLLQHILPELEACHGFEQHSRHHHLTVFEHTLLALDSSPPRLSARLGALFHDIAKPACFTIDDQQAGHFYEHHIIGIKTAEDAMQRLHYDRKTIQTVMLLVEHHMTRFNVFSRADARRLLQKVGEANLEDLFDLQAADIKASRLSDDFSQLERLQNSIEQIRTSDEPIHLRDLAIDGHDLLAIGFRQGPAVGSILNHLMELVIDHPELNSRDTLLDLAGQLLVNPD